MWNVSTAFEDALRSPVHTIAVRVDILDTDFNIIPGGRLQVDSAMTDGSVDVDTTRANRRTFSLNLLNNGAQFSPGTDLSGMFYVDRIIRIWRGVALGNGSEELVPVGTFMIDTADVIVERNMSVVTLAGQDLWKKLAKDQFVVPTTYAAGTPINTVIRDMATSAGVTVLALDPLSSRSSNQKNLNVARSYEVGDKVGEKLVQLCTDYSLDIYFDPLGQLVTAEVKDPADSPSVWTYEPAEASLLTQVTTTYSDDDLYNHVVVVGTGDEANPVRAEARDDDPTSATSINRIGDRVYRYESGVLSTQDAVDKAAVTIFQKKLALTEAVKLEAICNPAIEGNDVVTVREFDFARIDAQYSLTAFNVPLATSKQTLRMTRARRVNNGVVFTSGDRLVTLGLPTISWSTYHPGVSGHVFARPNLNIVNLTLLSAVASTLTPAYSDVIMGTSGLQMYLRLGESTGTTAFDETVNNHDGTWHGAPSLGASGAIASDTNSAVHFNNGDYITVPDSTGLRFGDGPVSFEWWMKRDTLQGAEVKVFDKATTGGIQITENDGTVILNVAGVAAICSSTVAASTGAWHHWVVTKSGSSCHIYLDGVDVTGTVTNSTASDTSATGQWVIGRHRNATDNQMIASLDEIAFYNVVLTATQVGVHYSAGTHVPAGPLAGVYVATTGNDSTGDGTVSNPWKTLGHAIPQLVAGQTCWVRGGTYTGTGSKNLDFGSMLPRSGTAGNPITLKAYPGESPVFDGQTTGSSTYFIITGSHSISYWTIDGLKLVNFNMNQNGIITVSGQGTSAKTTNWTIRNCDIQQVGLGTSDASNQIVYFGAYTDTMLVEDNILRGPYPTTAVTGAGIGTDHSPSCKNLVAQRNVLYHCHKGIQIYGATGSPDGVTATLLHNTFVGCGRNYDLAHYMTLTIRDNAGNTAAEGSGANIDTESWDSAGTLTQDHNDWGLTFNTDFTIASGAGSPWLSSDGTTRVGAK